MLVSTDDCFYRQVPLKRRPRRLGRYITEESQDQSGARLPADVQALRKADFQFAHEP